MYWKNFKRTKWVETNYESSRWNPVHSRRAVFNCFSENKPAICSWSQLLVCVGPSGRWIHVYGKSMRHLSLDPHHPHSQQVHALLFVLYKWYLCSVWLMWRRFRRFRKHSWNRVTFCPNFLIRWPYPYTDCSRSFDSGFSYSLLEWNKNCSDPSIYRWKMEHQGGISLSLLFNRFSPLMPLGCRVTWTISLHILQWQPTAQTTAFL